jgi:hypothetical protein
VSEKKQFLLRLPPELWAELNRWAQDELRSVNGQIEYILRQAVSKRGKPHSDGRAPPPPCDGVRFL